MVFKMLVFHSQEPLVQDFVVQVCHIISAVKFFLYMLSISHIRNSTLIPPYTSSMAQQEDTGGGKSQGQTKKGAPF